MHAFNILFLGFLFIKYKQNIMTEATKTSLCHKYTMGILIPSKKKKT